MTNILSGIISILVALSVFLGYKVISLQEKVSNYDLNILVKEKSINELKSGIELQNSQIEALRAEKSKKEIVYKEKIKYITKKIEVERQSVIGLSGLADCNKAKEIMNEIVIK